ncbi:MAG: DNA-binding transcriptional regulator [Phycisphaerales bacterium]|nr:MAG: DNA-binding transcriptional regulator [Phycisphaerales bacterium]
MRHVAILVETARAYGRGVIRGIARYNRERGRWSTYFQPQGLGDPPPPWIKKWKGDGIIARIDNATTARIVAKVGVPVVNLRSTLPDLGFPFIGADNQAVARLAAEHLLERGFRQFGLCGYRRGYHLGFDVRQLSFIEYVERAGCRCQPFTLRHSDPRPPSWEKEQGRIARWLSSLPRPVGILATNDDCGLQVLDACRRIELVVPDQVAVLGCENDVYACNLSIPPLSSIDLNSEQVGYEAAVLLDRLMVGKRAAKRPPEIQPLGVVPRRSTDVLATSHEEVVRALRFIRQHACRPIDVMDVVEHVRVPRTTLQMHVKEAIGRTIHQEIRRIQIARAKEQLSMASAPIKQVARDCGFKNVQYFTRAFHRATGETPARFQRRHLSDRASIS